MRDDAVSEVIGVILMVAIAVALAAAIFVTLTTLTSTNQSTMPKFPTFSQERDDGKLVVLYTGGQQEVKWSDLKINPNTVEINDEDNDGFLDAGEYIYNCTGKEVSVVYTPANILLGTWDFT